MRTGFRARICALVIACLLPACGDWPRDPSGTLDRARNGTIRVGVSSSPPWTDFERGKPSGIEVTLVEKLATELGARVEWKHAGETTLLEDLEYDRLDLVIGGITKSNPWSKQVAFTQPYHTAEREGKKEQRVWALPMGENGWMVHVEQFLFANQENAKQLVEQAGGAE